MGEGAGEGMNPNPNRIGRHIFGRTRVTPFVIRSCPPPWCPPPVRPFTLGWTPPLAAHTQSTSSFVNKREGGRMGGRGGGDIPKPNVHRTMEGTRLRPKTCHTICHQIGESHRFRPRTGPERPDPAPNQPRTAPNRPQICPELARNGREPAPNRPRTGPEPVPNRPRTSPEPARAGPSWPQTGPEWPRTGSGKPPGRPQPDPDLAQNRPERHQAGPEPAPNRWRTVATGR